MPAKQIGILPLPAPAASTARDRKKDEDEGDKEENEVPASKGLSSTAAAKRKRKTAGDKKAELLVEEAFDFTTEPLYNSETGEGERPTISSLSLPPFTFNPIHQSADTAYDDNTANQLPSSIPILTLIQKKKNSAAFNEAVNKFWKTIEEDNYFQPFSRNIHRMDDLALKGGDYSESNIFSLSDCLIFLYLH